MRKKLILFLFNFIFIVLIPNLGQWVRVYGSSGSDYITSVNILDDGSILMAGYSKSSRRDINYGTVFWDAIIWVAKLNPSGERMWLHSFRCDWEGESFIEQLNSLYMEEDGGFILTGWTKRLESKLLMVIKISPFGDILWNKVMGGSQNELGYDIIKSSGGGYIITGSTSSFSLKGTDVLVLKLNGEGDIIWQKSYGGSLKDEGRFIRQTKDNGYIFAGQTFSFYPFDGDIWVVKISSEGAVEWQKVLPKTGIDNISRLEILEDNSFMLVGTNHSEDNGTDDIWVVKMSETGVMQWQKAFNWGDKDEANGLVLLPEGGCLISATSKYHGIDHLVVFKLNAGGEIEWQKYFGDGFFQGEPTEEFSSCLSQTTEGGIIAGGRIMNLGTSNQYIFLLRLSNEGKIDNCYYVKESFLTGYSTFIVPKDILGFSSDIDMSVIDVELIHHGLNLDSWVLCPFKKNIPRR